MNQHSNNENNLTASSSVLDAEDPDNVGAFCEDALTEAESNESTAIPPEHLPEDYIAEE